MNRLVIALLGVTLAAAACGEPPEKKSAGEEVVDVAFFSGGRIIPGDGSEPIEDATMIVEQGKVKALGKKGEHQAPRGSLRVDLAGKTVMPMMINLHGHPGLNTGATFSPDNYKRENVTADLNRYLYYGVGAVIAAGSDPGDLAYQIRGEQRQGKTTGATLYTAGRGITAKGGWPASLGSIPIQVSTEADARKAVAENDKDNTNRADFIKIWVDDNMGKVPKLSPTLYKAIIDEAQKRKLRVIAHVFYLNDAKELVKAGVAGLVHSIRDREADEELISLMKEKNVFLAPTLTAHEAKFAYVDAPRWLGEQTMREVYPASLSAYLADPVIVNQFKRDPNLAAYRQQYATAQKNLKKMTDAGVKIGFGTDSGAPNTWPGYFEHRELELMGEAGMKPLDVIKAASVNSADALGAKDLGGIVVGKSADFLVLSDNPAADLVNSKEIDTVWWKGHQLKREPLIPKVDTTFRVTKEQRANEAQAQAKEIEDRKVAGMKHFGGVPMGPNSARARGNSFPTPYKSTSSVVQGPPDKITVTLAGANLSAFYREALPAYGWRAAGNCFEKTNAITNKLNQACVETSAATAVITVTER